MVNRVVETSENLDIKTNIEKTEIQHMGRVHKSVTIVIKYQNLEQMVNFKYLRGDLSSKEEIRHLRHQKVDRDNEGCIPCTMKDTRNMTTKLQVKETPFLSSLLYSSKTWTMKRS